MSNSITKALLFVIALGTSIIAIQLIPISRKSYLIYVEIGIIGGMNLIFFLMDIKVEMKKKKKNIVRLIKNQIIFAIKYIKNWESLQSYMAKKSLINFARELALIGL